MLQLVLLEPAGPRAHAVGFLWRPRAVSLSVMSVFVFCSWQLPVAVAGLQCWSWLTRVVVTTWGRLCWESFAHSLTLYRSVGSQSHADTGLILGNMYHINIQIFKENTHEI